jgi:hypothetical protein
MTHGRNTLLLSCRVPDGLAQWVKGQARRESTTVSQFIEGVLEKERLRLITPKHPTAIIARLRKLVRR